MCSNKFRAKEALRAGRAGRPSYESPHGWNPPMWMKIGSVPRLHSSRSRSGVGMPIQGYRHGTRCAFFKRLQAGTPVPRSDLSGAFGPVDLEKLDFRRFFEVIFFKIQMGKHCRIILISSNIFGCEGAGRPGGS